MRIAIMGGSGKEGLGLARGWALAGQDVVIGSRSAERAEQALVAAIGQLDCIRLHTAPWDAMFFLQEKLSRPTAPETPRKARNT